jgi:hypothetical protein
MEVHPPHAPLHTWKDFWIHLGTITIGLLIAISLEQSVEGLHHLHQRHQLEEDLDHEARTNQQYVALDSALLDRDAAWLLSLRRRVESLDKPGLDHAAAHSTFVFPEQIPGHPGDALHIGYHLPAVSVWTTAGESALTDLLSRNEARLHSNVYRQADYSYAAYDELRKAWQEMNEFEFRFDEAALPSHPNLLRMSPDQRSQYVALIDEAFLAARYARRRLKIYSVNLDAMIERHAMPDLDGYLAAHPDQYPGLDPDPTSKP